MDPVRLPDKAAFRGFEAECQAEQGWTRRYGRDGISIWGRPPPPGGDLALHRVKGRIDMPDVPAETVYDVLHDTKYRKKWDLNVIETYEIASLSDNADIGYYSWKCPKPLKNRDVVTLRSWQVLEDSYIILSFSVKHPKYPPRKDLVRAVSLLAGYLVQRTGPNSCSLTYLAQVDPKVQFPSKPFPGSCRIAQGFPFAMSFLPVWFSLLPLASLSYLQQFQDK
ncbi:START domain-containing protein 10-like isoform X2 [Sceloporus undulatus]|uniref:START domain-containing protein 10-like isoform X2 n=1 Tax=Sceloporus undulatus TaxID=8520 RepID=UPI001C4AE12C|nr:START domain-containing protein 10-like isoform X2 [Sceloporus undulatus]